MVEGQWGIHRDFRTNWRCAYPIIHIIPIRWTEEGMHFYVLCTTFETSHPFFSPSTPTNPQHNLLVFVASVTIVITCSWIYMVIYVASSKTLFLIWFWKPSHNPMNENAQRNWYQDSDNYMFFTFLKGRPPRAFSQDPLHYIRLKSRRITMKAT
jgi:hypothetical protein